MIEHRDEDLSGSSFRNVDLSRASFRSAVLREVAITDAWVDDVRVEGHIGSLVVNGVDVTAYVDEELDRRHPERVDLRSSDVEVLRRAWSRATARSDEVVARARRLPARLLDRRVDDEYSFIETLRHLVFASDRWLAGPVFGDPPPHVHPIGLAFEGADETETDGLDPDARPSLDEVLDVRRHQHERTRALLRDLSADGLRRAVPSPNGGETTVEHCLHVVLNEEWWHHQYAERDLAILEALSD